MARADYDVIKDRFERYIKTWNTRDKAEIKAIVDPFIFFSTSTSIRMANGAQDSIFGVYDFLNDFPVCDVLHTKIYNYVCRIDEKGAYGYADVVCTAFTIEKTIKYLEFTAHVATRWSKKSGEWMMTSLRQEVVAERGNLKEEFEKYWHFENEVGGRIQIVRGEADSPWLNVPNAEDVLTEEEKVKDAIYKNRFGEELNNFTHCYETYSDNYGSYTIFGADGYGKKELVTEKKASRAATRYFLNPVKIKKIEIDGDRAYVDLDQVRGVHQDTGGNASTDGNINVADRVKNSKKNTRGYEYNEENMHVEHTCARGNFELVKENGEWKVAYHKVYHGIYEIGGYGESLYGDEC
ncbi:MAG: hypothetical protein IJ356_04640 [Erysipelotrichaceae bacterium]|nr:hypothetical protein [Erysipelotrichaceae bacterium]